MRHLLTPAEQDRFIVEQFESARLIDIEDIQALPSNYSELETYINSQQGWLSLTVEVAEVTRTLRKPSFRSNPIKVWSFIIVQDGALSLLPGWARLLYGIEGRPMNLRSAARTTKTLMGWARKSQSYGELIGAATARVEDHPYRKVCATR